MQTLTLGWDLEISPGEGWLIIRPRPQSPSSKDLVPLAEEIAKLLEWYLVDRVVLVLDGIDLLNSFLVGQLVKLHKVVESRNGLLRLCGLTPSNLAVLERVGATRRLAVYNDVQDAVMGSFPDKPR